MKRNIRKLIGGVLIFCQLFAMTAYARPNWPSDTGIMAEAGVLMDVDSGTMMFGQNSRVEYPPASITKILTALIVLEHADLADTVTFSETAMNSVEIDSGNKMSLVAGDTLTVEDALYAMLLLSVNQAANALAEHVAGSIPAFVDMMNAKLTELGCEGSHFENPSGLNGDSQNVSAYDMAKIACAAYQNPKLLEISSAISRKVGATTNYPGGYTVQNEHRLVVTDDSSSEFYYPEAVAGKTGYLLKAGNTLVTYAEKDGRRQVSVILMGSPRQYFLDGKELLQFGFYNFKNVNIAENETRYVTGDAPVELYGTSYAPADLMIEADREITLPKTASFGDAEVRLVELPENHPVNAVGRLQYVYNERRIGSAYLLDKTIEVPEETVEAVAEVTEGETESAEPSDGENEPESEETEPAETETPEDSSQDAGTEPADTDGSDGAGTFHGGAPRAAILLAGGILVLAAAGIGFWFWLSGKRKKEAAAAAERRERRRQRLLEEGEETEAEFNRLMEELQSRREERRKK